MPVLEIREFKGWETKIYFPNSLILDSNFFIHIFSYYVSFLYIWKRFAMIWKKNTKGFTVILICFISVTFLRMKSIFCLKFTNRWFSVVTRNIMPFDTIGIEIVENANTNFVAISIVRLRFSFANLFCAVRIFFLSAIKKNCFFKTSKEWF